MMPKTSPQMPVKLAEAAFRCFAERGFKEVNLDQIAAKAGVTKGSLYCHYKSKQELILAACNHYYRAYQRRVQKEIAPLTDPLERLRCVVELSVHTCVIDRKTRVFTTEIFALSLQNEQVRTGWAQFYDTVREIYVGLIMAAVAARQLDTPDPRAAADMMLAAIEGIKIRAGFEPHIADADEQKIIVDGLMNILGRNQAA